MNESEWLTSADPQPMLRHLNGQAGTFSDAIDMARRGISRPALISARKLRLFACACARQVGDGVPCNAGCHLDGNDDLCRSCHGTGRVGGLTDPRSRRAVEVAEMFADGAATAREFDQAVTEEADGTTWPGWAGEPFLEDARAAAIYTSRYFTTGGGPRVPPAVQAQLLRCLAGNPFRVVPYQWLGGNLYEREPAHPWPPPPREKLTPLPWLAWQNGTVPLLARALYEENDFTPGRLGILADSLTEAGCDTVSCTTGCRKVGGTYRLADGSLCPSCHGSTGNRPHPLQAHLRGLDTGPCPYCKGAGIHRYGLVKCDGADIHDTRGEAECVACRGSGRAPAAHAKGCHAVDLLLGRD